MEWTVGRELDEGDLRVISDGVIDHGRSLAAAGGARPLACLLRDDGRVIAGATGRTEFRRLFVLYLWVSPEHRRRGHATQALRRLEHAARVAGCRDALIETLDDAVAGSYQRLGYQPVAVVRGYVGPFNRHTLVKALGPASTGVEGGGDR